MAEQGGGGAASDSDDEVELLQYKVVVLGDGAIGKTSMIMKFTEDAFAKKYKQTIGVDFFIKHIVLPGDIRVALQVWDIGGQSIGSKMIHNYIYGANAVLLCYDITNYQSFQNLEDWLTLVKKSYQDASLPYLALIGNKCDLKHLRTVKQSKHTTFADENQMFSYFVSAKTGDNLRSSFTRISADLAGIVLSKTELDATAAVIPAPIVNHPQHDPAQKHIVLDEQGGKSSKCSIQ
jgi:Ras-related protein Rab-28